MLIVGFLVVTVPALVIVGIAVWWMLTDEGW